MCSGVGHRCKAEGVWEWIAKATKQRNCEGTTAMIQMVRWAEQRCALSMEATTKDQRRKGELIAETRTKERLWTI